MEYITAGTYVTCGMDLWNCYEKIKNKKNAKPSMSGLAFPYPRRPAWLESSQPRDAIYCKKDCVILPLIWGRTLHPGRLRPAPTGP